MAELSLDVVAEVVESCKAGAAEAAAALGRGLDAEVQLSVGEPASIDMQALPEALAGPGLAIVLTLGSRSGDRPQHTGALVLVPESSGLLPAWYGDPDPAGRGKLANLAREMGAALLPEQYSPDGFSASKVQSLSGALAAAGVSDGAAMVPLALQRGEDTRATAHLIWPAVNPAAVTGEEAAEPKPDAESQPCSAGVCDPADSSLGSAGRPATTSASQRGRRTVDDLPVYSRSLLRIKLPVVVTLARKCESVGRIVELGPGSIIQFEKSCDEMLELDIGGRSIATGAAVKVGDKFGLRINSMTLPDERFAPVRKG